MTTTYEALQLAPIGLREANAWVDLMHRHHEPVGGHKFSVSVLGEEGTLVGVGIAGRPKAKPLQANGYIEIVRVATDGTPNAPSMIYGSLRGAAVRLGYPAHKVITYTLDSEPGTSLLAAGFVFDGMTDGGSWDRPGRPRTDKAPIVPKKRWIGARRPESEGHHG